MTNERNNWSTALEARLSRMESRLVQLMLHFGLDPYSRTYTAQHPDQQPTSNETQPHPSEHKHEAR